MIKLSSILFAIALLSIGQEVQAQASDSVRTVGLKEVIINDESLPFGVDRMPDVKDDAIYSGKKTEVLKMDKVQADLSTNNTRQAFAGVPGLSVWENDGSGIQVGVATRGLSPNRSWEFNVRQNGYDICSEIFGYPEAYYNPPMEALESIVIVRGASSLQYGPQFGGLLNYKIKKGTPGKIIGFETQQTVGSYGLFNTYNAIGGNYKKFSYYAYVHHRSSDGWRQNSRYNIYTGYASASYQLTEKLKVTAEYTRMDYESQQPGGLTDAQFEADHRQSGRKRNWFGTPWNVAALSVEYAINPAVHMNVKAFTTMAERNSVGFTNGPTVNDTVNTNTFAYNPRQVDRDKYENFGIEARTSWRYNLFGKPATLAGGIRVYDGATERNQLGTGTTGNDFDLTLSNPDYGRALEFGTKNYAVFAEHILPIGSRLKVIPGFRYESIESSISGYINTSATGNIGARTSNRQFLLYGIGGEFTVSPKTEIYSNYSLSYRPVTFSELTPSSTTEVIDPDLEDASGFNFDLGYRGTVKNYLSFDAGIFFLKYDNRIGTISQNGNPLRTNIGTSESRGIETYVELDIAKWLCKNTKSGISIFASNALIKAEYVTWNNPAIANDPSKAIEGKRVENAPEYIHRFGATAYHKGLSASFQLSSVGNVFSDAANTEAPNAAGTIGNLPAYQVMDASVSWKFLNHYRVKAGINNLADEKYATRRAGGYPGPGVIPGNGRTFFVTVGANF